MSEAASSSVEQMSLGARFWRFPLTRILAYLLLFGLCSCALAVPVGVVSVLMHIPPTLFLLMGEGVAAIGALLAFWIMVRFADRRTLASAGYTRRGILTETVAGLLLGAALFSAAIGLLTLAGVYHVTGNLGLSRPFLPLLLFLFVSLVEETIFRGYVLQTLEARWGTGVALAGSSLLFGLVHLTNSVHGATPWQTLAGPLYIAFEAGLPLAGAYLLTRRLWLPLGIHWAWNFFESYVYGVPDSGVVIGDTFLRSRLTGPVLLTGGTFGPEAGLACLLVGVTGGFVLVWMTVRRGQWRPRRPVKAPDERNDA